MEIDSLVNVEKKDPLLYNEDYFSPRINEEKFQKPQDVWLLCKQTKIVSKINLPGIVWIDINSVHRELQKGLRREIHFTYFKNLEDAALYIQNNLVQTIIIDADFNKQAYECLKKDHIKYLLILNKQGDVQIYDGRIYELKKQIEKVQIFTIREGFKIDQIHQRIKQQFYSPFNALPNFIELSVDKLQQFNKKRISLYSIEKSIGTEEMAFLDFIQICKHLTMPKDQIQTLKYQNLKHPKQVLRQYTKETQFYKILNQSLRTVQNPLQAAWFRFPYSKMRQAIAQQFKQEAWVIFEVYRGAYISPKEYELLEKNKIYENLGFLSTSLSEKIAKKFIKNCLIKITVNDIQKKSNGYCQLKKDISKHQFQKEILFNTNNLFRLKQKKANPDTGKWEIHLEMINEPPQQLRQSFEFFQTYKTDYQGLALRNFDSNSALKYYGIKLNIQIKNGKESAATLYQLAAIFTEKEQYLMAQEYAETAQYIEQIQNPVYYPQVKKTFYQLTQRKYKIKNMLKSQFSESLNQNGQFFQNLNLLQIIQKKILDFNIGQTKFKKIYLKDIINTALQTQQKRHQKIAQTQILKQVIHIYLKQPQSYFQKIMDSIANIYIDEVLQNLNNTLQSDNVTKMFKKSTISVYIFKGIALTANGDLDMALLYYKKALTIPIDFNQFEKIIFTKMANIFSAKRQYNNAINYLQKALDIIYNKYGKGHTKTIGLLAQIASLYNAKNEQQNALSYLNQLLDILKKDGHIMAILNLIAEVYIAKGQYQKALDIVYQNNEKGYVVIINMARVLIIKGQYQWALNYLQILQDVQIHKNYIQVAYILNNMAIAFIAKGQYISSLKYFQKVFDMMLIMQEQEQYEPFNHQLETNMFQKEKNVVIERRKRHDIKSFQNPLILIEQMCKRGHIFTACILNNIANVCTIKLHDEVIQQYTILYKTDYTFIKTTKILKRNLVSNRQQQKTALNYKYKAMAIFQTYGSRVLFYRRPNFIDRLTVVFQTTLCSLFFHSNLCKDDGLDKYCKSYVKETTQRLIEFIGPQDADICQIVIQALNNMTKAEKPLQKIISSVMPFVSLIFQHDGKNHMGIINTVCQLSEIFELYGDILVSERFQRLYLRMLIASQSIE